MSADRQLYCVVLQACCFASVVADRQQSCKTRMLLCADISARICRCCDLFPWIRVRWGCRMCSSRQRSVISTPATPLNSKSSPKTALKCAVFPCEGTSTIAFSYPSSHPCGLLWASYSVLTACTWMDVWLCTCHWGERALSTGPTCPGAAILMYSVQCTKQLAFVTAEFRSYLCSTYTLIHRINADSRRVLCDFTPATIWVRDFAQSTHSTFTVSLTIP